MENHNASFFFYSKDIPLKVKKLYFFPSAVVTITNCRTHVLLFLFTEPCTIIRIHGNTGINPITKSSTFA